MRKRFEKSSDTHILEGLFTKAEIGDIVTYEEMTKSIGRDVREFAHASIRSALRAAERQGIIFEARPNVGYVRLNDAEIVKKSDADKTSIRKKTERAMDRLGVVKFDELSDADKKKHTVTSAQLGAIRMFSTSSATKKIESKVKGSSSVIPIGETLKMFTGE